MTPNSHDPSPAAAVNPAVRYHYMDNLRALAMLLGIFFHAAISYGPMLQQIWIPANSEVTVAMDVWAWFTHLFRMPLFFLIAGFFTCYLVGKRGVGGLLKNRAVRILVPFVVFLPLVWVSMGMGIGWAVENVENPSPMLGLVAMMANMPDAPPPPVTTTHLWFLYNLAQFYLVYVLLEKLGLMRQNWIGLLASPRFVVFVLPLLIAPALATQASPHPAPEQFLPSLWSFGFFGVFFLVGVQFFRQQDLLDRLRPYAPWLLVTSLALYAWLFTQFPKSVTLEQAMATMQGGQSISAIKIAVSLVEALIAVHMTVVCLVAGKRFMDKANPAIRFIADSSYWVYIIHLPVLWFIQYLLLDTQWNLWMEFALSSLGTLAIGIVSYALLVRWTPVGWLLNGRRPRAPAAVAPTLQNAPNL